MMQAEQPTVPLLKRIEDVTGKLDSRRVRDLETGDLAILWNPLSRICDVNDAIPRREAGRGFRPYISKYTRDANRALAEVHSGSNVTPQILRSACQALVEKLLYCGSIVIDDPITHLIADAERHMFGRYGFGEEYESPTTYDLRRLKNVLEFVTTIRPLVQEGLIILSPPEYHWYSGWLYGDSKPNRAPNGMGKLVFWSSGERDEPDSGEGYVPLSEEQLARYSGANDDLFATAAMREHLAAIGMSSRRVEVTKAFDRVAVSVGRFVRHPGLIDFEINDRLSGMALAEFFAFIGSGESAGSSIDPITIPRYDQLFELPMLQLNAFTLDDLMAIHDSGFLKSWRSNLGIALGDIRNQLSPFESDYDVKARQHVAEKLLLAVASQGYSEGQSVWTIGAQTLSFGAITAGVAALSNSILAGLGVAASTAGVQIAWTSLARLQKRRNLEGKTMEEIIRMMKG